jgi:hypothetical protein
MRAIMKGTRQEDPTCPFRHAGQLLCRGGHAQEHYCTQSSKTGRQAGRGSVRSVPGTVGSRVLTSGGQLTLMAVSSMTKEVFVLETCLPVNFSVMVWPA